jgi:hypothetical protein
VFTPRPSDNHDDVRQADKGLEINQLWCKETEGNFEWIGITQQVTKLLTSIRELTGSITSRHND